MTVIKIKEFTIKGRRVQACSGDIYTKIGLTVTTKPNTLKIKSSKKAKIKSISTHIHVHIYDINTIKVLMEEGFCREDDGQSRHVTRNISDNKKSNNAVLEMVDELGNKILATFISKSIRKIAVLTSGGDAPGMNGAIRAIVRTARKWGSEVYGVYYGYDGLINDSIEELSWDSVGYHSSHGGTFLLSARSKAFLGEDGRKEAVYNLAKRGIDGLIVMGGDGSIKGAMVLKKEFAGCVAALVKEGRLEKKAGRLNLKILAIPASIDNDISNSDMTLGADSCLHRVIGCVDSLTSTMVSHRRAFVIEVMGRSCGWIALMASFAIGADYVFIPEAPHTNWKADVVGSVCKARTEGKLGSFVVLAEGACDSAGKRIEADEVCKLIQGETQIECRVLKLGHIQRGGRPSAFDRILSTLLGCKAVENMFSEADDTPSMVTLVNGDYTIVSLVKVDEDNEKVARLQKEKDFEGILEARGKMFNRAYRISEQLRKGQPGRTVAVTKTDGNVNVEMQPVAAVKQGRKKNRAKKRRKSSADKDSTGMLKSDSSGMVKSDSTGMVKSDSTGMVKSDSTGMVKSDSTGMAKSDSTNTLTTSSSLEESSLSSKINTGNLAIVHDGQRAGGMNVALHIIVKYATSLGQDTYVINDGFEGLLSDQVHKAKQYEFISGIFDGGSIIGSSLTKKPDAEAILKKLEQHNINKLVVIGGREALKTVAKIQALQNKHSKSSTATSAIESHRSNDTNHESAKENNNTASKDTNKVCNKTRHKVSIVLIPTAIENDIPGTDMCVGADTALNCITVGCDFLRYSSMAMKKTVFVIEIQGGSSGYLGLFGGIAAGAFDCFIPERKYLISHLGETAQRLKYRFRRGNRHGILLVKNQGTFNNISLDAFSKIITTDGEGLYDAKYCLFGDLVQGGNPMAYDRICATVFGVAGVDVLLGIGCEDGLRDMQDVNVGVIGMRGQDLVFTDVAVCLDEYNRIKKGETKARWLVYSNICRSME